MIVLIRQYIALFLLVQKRTIAYFETAYTRKCYSDSELVSLDTPFYKCKPPFDNKSGQTNTTGQNWPGSLHLSAISLNQQYPKDIGRLKAQDAYCTGQFGTHAAHEV